MRSLLQRSMRILPLLALFVAAVTAGLVAAAARDEPADDALERRLTGFVANSYDSARGGFATREGEPRESAVDVAWRLARDGDATWRGRARRTVLWTWSMFDSVGGGFLQHERDARHDVASFEKRTDSNARRLENRVDAWLDARFSQDPAAGGDRRAVLEVLDYFQRVLLDPRGGFIAGQVGEREVVPASSGAAIHAYLRWAAASGETRWRDFAWKSLDRAWSETWNAEFGFLRLGAMGQVISVPRLEDQVEMGRAYALAAHVGGREQDLDRARATGDVLLARFEDPRQGGMRVQVALARDGRVKSAARDPLLNARAARFLGELASVTGEARYRDAARRLVRAFVPGRTRPAPDDADWVLALRAISRSELPERAPWPAAPARSRPADSPPGKPKSKTRG